MWYTTRACAFRRKLFFFLLFFLPLCVFQLAINYCSSRFQPSVPMMNFVFIYLWGFAQFSQWIWLLPHYGPWFALLQPTYFSVRSSVLLLWLFIWLLNKICSVCVCFETCVHGRLIRIRRYFKSDRCVSRLNVNWFRVLLGFMSLHFVPFFCLNCEEWFCFLAKRSRFQRSMPKAFMS